LNVIDAARAFVEYSFPACDAAFVAGSAVRGEATTTSDLDIVIVTRDVKAPFLQVAVGGLMLVTALTSLSKHQG